MRNPKTLRTLALLILVPWILAAGIAAAMLHDSSTARLDVNGEPLSYNAPCSTDTDCVARFGF